MSIQHTTAGWAHALTAALTAAAGGTAVLDAGRELLATSTPGPLNVNRGFATSKFSLPRGRVTRPRLLVTELSSHQWDQIDDAIAAHPDAHRMAGTAAISDQLTNPALTAGIPLIPEPQEISHTCTCAPNATFVPCAHVTAVGLLLADRLRTAPAPLFTLRGRPHQHLKKRLRFPSPAQEPAATTPATTPPSSAPAPVTDPPAAAIPAQSAAPIPKAVDLDLSDPPTVLTSALTAPPAPLPGLEALSALAADAAHHAGLLLDGDEPPTCPGLGSDLARFVSLPHGAPFRQTAMDHLGLDIVGMSHLTLAYTYGGPAGAAAYLEPLTVDHDVLAHAQADIQPLRPAPTATIECHDNRLTDEAAGIQLRYGPDGRWHPYRARYGTWQPAPGPDASPATAYKAARTTTRPNRRTHA